jgi:hypothetical protein
MLRGSQYFQLALPTYLLLVERMIEAVSAVFVLAPIDVLSHILAQQFLRDSDVVPSMPLPVLKSHYRNDSLLFSARLFTLVGKLGSTLSWEYLMVASRMSSLDPSFTTGKRWQSLP